MIAPALFVVNDDTCKLGPATTPVNALAHIGCTGFYGNRVAA